LLEKFRESRFIPEAKDDCASAIALWKQAKSRTDHDPQGALDKKLRHIQAQRSSASRKPGCDQFTTAGNDFEFDKIKLTLSVVADSAFERVAEQAGGMSRARDIEKPFGTELPQFPMQINLRNARLNADRSCFSIVIADSIKAAEINDPCGRLSG
jgi:hypothetical protein